MSIVANSAPLVEQLAGRTALVVRGWAPGAMMEGIEPLAVGVSGLTFMATLSGVPARYERVVLKVALPAPDPARARDVLRQARILEVLARRPGVPVPKVLFCDVGAPPGTLPFVALERVPGECLEPVLAPRGTVPAGQVRARALEAARTLAELHRVNPRHTVLADEPVVSLHAEIDRWTWAFATVPDGLRAGYEAVAARLHATAPPAMAPVFRHGDYRLGHTLCMGGAVTALIDWENWSLGDPRFDLTWLTCFTDEAGHPGSVSDEPTGMPGRAELIDAYQQARGGALRDLPWFEALAKYKESAASARLITRARKAGRLSDTHRRMLPALPVLLDQAMGLLCRQKKYTL